MVALGRPTCLSAQNPASVTHPPSGSRKPDSTGNESRKTRLWDQSALCTPEKGLVIEPTTVFTNGRIYSHHTAGQQYRIAEVRTTNLSNANSYKVSVEGPGGGSAWSCTMQQPVSLIMAYSFWMRIPYETRFKVEKQHNRDWKPVACSSPVTHVDGPITTYTYPCEDVAIIFAENFQQYPSLPNDNPITPVDPNAPCATEGGSLGDGFTTLCSWFTLHCYNFHYCRNGKHQYYGSPYLCGVCGP